MTVVKASQGHPNYWGPLRLVWTGGCWWEPVCVVTTLVLTSYIRPQISQSVGGTGQALTALVWLSYFQSSVLWVLSQSSSRQTAAGGLGNLSLFYGIWIKYWCDFDWGIRQPSVHQYRQFASSVSVCGIFYLRPLCTRLCPEAAGDGDWVPAWRGSREDRQRGD